VVVEPASGLKATIDVYRIDIDARIVLSDNFTGGQLTAILAPLGASGARFFTNAIDTKTQGVDLTVDYRVPLGSDNGRLDLTASYNHNTTELVSVIPTPPQLQGFDNTLFSRVAPNDLEFRRYTCAQPKNSFRFSGTYEIGRVGVTARQNLYGAYCSLEAINQIYPAEWVTDLEGTFKLQKATIGFGVQNLFNELPDTNIPAVSFFNVRTFPRNSPFGFNGRYVYGRITYKF